MSALCQFARLHGMTDQIVSDVLKCTTVHHCAPLLLPGLLAALQYHTQQHKPASSFGSALPHCHVAICLETTFKPAAVLWLLPNDHQQRVFPADGVHSDHDSGRNWCEGD